MQHFMIFTAKTYYFYLPQSLKEIHSGRETGLIDTGPLVETISFEIDKCKSKNAASVSEVLALLC